MVREFQWSLRNGVDFFKHNLLFLLGPYTLLQSVLPFVFQTRQNRKLLIRMGK